MSKTLSAARREIASYPPSRLLGGEWTDICAHQDDCLIAIEDGHPLPTRALLALPPWRAVLMARVAEKSGVGLEQGTLEQLIEEARIVTGSGRLGNWWERKE